MDPIALAAVLVGMRAQSATTIRAPADDQQSLRLRVLMSWR